MRRDVYAALGGHVDRVRPVEEVVATERHRIVDALPINPWPLAGVPGSRTR
jgi:hypothetical protein